MANNPFMRDTTILNESTYLSELKEQTQRIDPLTRHILEKQETLLNESLMDLVKSVLGTNDFIISPEDMRKIIDGATIQGHEVGYKQGMQQGMQQGVKQGMESGAKEAFAVTIVAAIVGMIGVIVYQRFLSTAARVCKGKSGMEKSVCMQKYKADALEAKYKAIHANAKHCDRSKNPAKCKAMVAQKLNTTKNELRKVKSKK